MRLAWSVFLILLLSFTTAFAQIQAPASDEPPQYNYNYATKVITLGTGMQIHAVSGYITPTFMGLSQAIISGLTVTGNFYIGSSKTLIANYDGSELDIAVPVKASTSISQTFLYLKGTDGTYYPAFKMDSNQFLEAQRGLDVIGHITNTGNLTVGKAAVSNTLRTEGLTATKIYIKDKNGTYQPAFVLDSNTYLSATRGLGVSGDITGTRNGTFTGTVTADNFVTTGTTDGNPIKLPTHSYSSKIERTSQGSIMYSIDGLMMRSDYLFGNNINKCFDRTGKNIAVMHSLVPQYEITPTAAVMLMSPTNTYTYRNIQTSAINTSWQRSCALGTWFPAVPATQISLTYMPTTGSDSYVEYPWSTMYEPFPSGWRTHDDFVELFDDPSVFSTGTLAGLQSVLTKTNYYAQTANFSPTSGDGVHWCAESNSYAFVGITRTNNTYNAFTSVIGNGFVDITPSVMMWLGSRPSHPRFYKTLSGAFYPISITNTYNFNTAADIDIMFYLKIDGPNATSGSAKYVNFGISSNGANDAVCFSASTVGTSNTQALTLTARSNGSSTDYGFFQSPYDIWDDNTLKLYRIKIGATTGHVSIYVGSTLIRTITTATRALSSWDGIIPFYSTYGGMTLFGDPEYSKNSLYCVRIRNK